MKTKSKRWRYRAGRRPFTVTVEELEPGGNLYVRIWNAAKGDYQYRSLKHRDRKRAMQKADQMAVAREQGREQIIREKVTLRKLFKLYRRYRSPQKASETQGEDRRRVTLFTRVLGPDKDPSTISLAEWERFIALRASGTISSRGEPMPAGKRKPVGKRTIEADLIWLKAVLNWAMNWRTEAGYLLSENPVRGYPRPKEKNPKRPVASLDRIDAIRRVAGDVTMEVLQGKKRLQVRTHLPEIFEVVVGTGRRVSAVRQLRYSDLRLHEGPYGSILWPADTDKIGYESLVPLSPSVRTAIDRVLADRPGIGGAYLFPSPKDPSSPVRYELARQWLLDAEKLAGVPKMDGSLWHAYRRTWATQRKHLPDVDVAAAGGWKNAITLKAVYQQADPDTMLRVVMEGTG